ncbi:hypothetical protein AB0F59_32240, partial [Micromonospora lupini]
MMERVKPLQEYVAGTDTQPVDLVVMAESDTADRVWAEVRLPGRAEPVSFGPGESCLLDPFVRVLATIPIERERLTYAILAGLKHHELWARSLSEGNSEFVRRFAKEAVGHRITDALMTASVRDFVDSMLDHSSRTWSDAAKPVTALSDADITRLTSAEALLNRRGDPGRVSDARVWAAHRVAIDHQRPVVTGYRPSEVQRAQLAMLDSFATLVAARQAEQGEEAGRELSRQLGRTYGTLRNFTLLRPSPTVFQMADHEPQQWLTEFLELARPLQEYAQREEGNPARDIELVLLCAPARLNAGSPGHAVVAIRLPDGKQVALGFHPKKGLFGAQGKVDDDSRYVSALYTRVLRAYNINAQQLRDAYLFATNRSEANYHLFQQNCVEFATRLVAVATGSEVVNSKVIAPNTLIAALSDQATWAWADNGAGEPVHLSDVHEKEVAWAREYLALLGKHTDAYGEALSWARFRVAVDHQRPLITVNVEEDKDEDKYTARERSQLAMLDGFIAMIAAELHVNGELAAASLSRALGQTYGTLRVPIPSAKDRHLVRGTERVTGPLAKSRPSYSSATPADVSGHVVFDADDEERGDVEAESADAVEPILDIDVYEVNNHLAELGHDAVPSWQGVVTGAQVTGEGANEALGRMAALVAAGPVELLVVTQAEMRGAADALAVLRWAVPRLRPMQAARAALWERFAVRVERRALEGPDHTILMSVHALPKPPVLSAEDRELVDGVNRQLGADWPVSAAQVLRARAEVGMPGDSVSQVEARIVEFIRSFGRQARLLGAGSDPHPASDFAARDRDSEFQQPANPETLTEDVPTGEFPHPPAEPDSRSDADVTVARFEIVQVRHGRWSALDAAVLSAPAQVMSLLRTTGLNGPSPALSRQAAASQSSDVRALEWLGGLRARLNEHDRRAEVIGNGDFHDAVARFARRLSQEAAQAADRSGSRGQSPLDAAADDALSEARAQVAQGAAAWGERFSGDRRWLVVLAQVLGMRLLIGSRAEPGGRFEEVPGVDAQAPVLRLWHDHATNYRAWLERPSQTDPVPAVADNADDGEPPPPTSDPEPAPAPSASGTLDDPLTRQTSRQLPPGALPAGPVFPWFDRDAYVAELIGQLDLRRDLPPRGLLPRGDLQRRAVQVTDALRWWQGTVGGTDAFSTVVAGVRLIEALAGAPAGASMLSADAAATILAGLHSAITQTERTGAAGDRIDQAANEVKRLTDELAAVAPRLGSEQAAAVREVLRSAAALRRHLIEHPVTSNDPDFDATEPLPVEPEAPDHPEVVGGDAGERGTSAPVVEPAALWAWRPQPAHSPPNVPAARWQDEAALGRIVDAANGPVVAAAVIELTELFADVRAHVAGTATLTPQQFLQALETQAEHAAIEALLTAHPRHEVLRKAAVWAAGLNHRPVTERESLVVAAGLGAALETLAEHAGALAATGERARSEAEALLEPDGTVPSELPESLRAAANRGGAIASSLALFTNLLPTPTPTPTPGTGADDVGPPSPLEAGDVEPVPPVPEAAWYVERGALGEFTVSPHRWHNPAGTADHLAALLDADPPSLANDATRRAVINGVRYEIHRMLHLSQTLDEDAQQDHWDRLLTEGVTFSAAKHLVWLKPRPRRLVVRDPQPPGGRYGVSFASSTTEWATTQAVEKSLVDIGVEWLFNAATKAFSRLLVGGPELSLSTRGEHGATRSLKVISGRKLFATRMIEFTGELTIDVTLDGGRVAELPVPAEDNNFAIRLPAQYAESRRRPDFDAPLTKDRDHRRQTEVGGRETLNAVDVSELVLGLHRALAERTDLSLDTKVEVARRMVADVLNERALRNRSIAALSNGVVMDPVMTAHAQQVRPRIRLSPTAMQYLPGRSLPKVNIREDRGVMIGTSRSRDSDVTVTISADGLARGLTGVPDSSSSGNLGLAPEVAYRRGTSTSINVTTGSHTVLNTEDDQHLYRTSFRGRVEFLGAGIPPVVAPVEGELGVLARDRADFELRHFGRELPVGATPLIELPAEPEVRLSGPLTQRELDARVGRLWATRTPVPGVPPVLFAGLGHGEAVLTRWPGIENVLPAAERMLREAVGGMPTEPGQWARAFQVLEAAYGQSTLEAEPDRLWVGAQEDFDLGGRTYHVLVTAYPGPVDPDLGTDPLTANTRALRAPAVDGAKSRAVAVGASLDGQFRLGDGGGRGVASGSLPVDVEWSGEQSVSAAQKEYVRSEVETEHSVRVPTIITIAVSERSGAPTVRQLGDGPLFEHLSVPGFFPRDESLPAVTVARLADDDELGAGIPFDKYGASGIRPFFGNLTELVHALEELYDAAHHLAPNEMTRPKVIREIGQAISLAAAFRSLVDPQGWFVPLGRRSGLDSAAHIKMVVTDVARSATDQDGEIENYSQQLGKTGTATGRSVTVGAAAGGGGQVGIGYSSGADDDQSSSMRLAGIRGGSTSHTEGGESAHEDGKIAISRETTRGAHYRGSLELSVRVLTWKPGSASSSSTRKIRLRVENGVTFLANSRQASLLGLPSAEPVPKPAVTRVPLDRDLARAFTHVEHLHAPDILQAISSTLRLWGVVPAVPRDREAYDLLRSQLDETFRSHRLESAHFDILGSGLLGWFPVLDGPRTGYLSVEVKAIDADRRPIGDVTRAGVEGTYRSEGLTEDEHSEHSATHHGGYFQTRGRAISDKGTAGGFSHRTNWGDGSSERHGEVTTTKQIERVTVKNQDMVEFLEEINHVVRIQFVDLPGALIESILKTYRTARERLTASERETEPASAVQRAEIPVPGTVRSIVPMFLTAPVNAVGNGGMRLVTPPAPPLPPSGVWLSRAEVDGFRRQASYNDFVLGDEGLQTLALPAANDIERLVNLVHQSRWHRVTVGERATGPSLDRAETPAEIGLRVTRAATESVLRTHTPELLSPAGHRIAGTTVRLIVTGIRLLHGEDGASVRPTLKWRGYQQKSAAPMESGAKSRGGRTQLAGDGGRSVAKQADPSSRPLTLEKVAGGAGLAYGRESGAEAGSELSMTVERNRETRAPFGFLALDVVLLVEGPYGEALTDRRDSGMAVLTSRDDAALARAEASTPSAVPPAPSFWSRLRSQLSTSWLARTAPHADIELDVLPTAGSDTDPGPTVERAPDLFSAAEMSPALAVLGEAPTGSGEHGPGFGGDSDLGLPPPPDDSEPGPEVGERPVLDEDDAAMRAAFPWLASVNPDGSNSNCVLTAIASDMNAAEGGSVVWQAPSEDVRPEVELLNYQRQQLGLADEAPLPVYRADAASVRAVMLAARPGARGALLLRDRTGGVSHAFNVLRVEDDRDGVVFLDGQLGGVGRIPESWPGRSVIFLPLTEDVAWPVGLEMVDPAELNGEAGALGIELERKAIVISPNESRVERGSVLATWRREPGGPELMWATVDDGMFFEDSEDGMLHDDSFVEDSETAVPRLGEWKGFPIVEDISAPVVVFPDGDAGRPTWETVRRAMRVVTSKLARVPRWQRGEQERAVAIESIYSEAAGWTITEDGRGLRLVLGNDTNMYAQWNIGLPVGDGLALAEWLLEDGRSYGVPRELLTEGLEFGRDVVARYLGVPRAEADHYRAKPGVSELWDLMIHAYTHTSAAVFPKVVASSYEGHLAKNLLLMALRNPMQAVRASLPLPVRVYLDLNSTTIKSLWEDRFRRARMATFSQERWKVDLASSLEFFEHEKYLDNALLRKPEVSYEQNYMGINRGPLSAGFENLDTNDGRLPAAAVYELRFFRETDLSDDEVESYRSEIVNSVEVIRESRMRAEHDGTAGGRAGQSLAEDLSRFMEKIRPDRLAAHLRAAVQAPLGTISRHLGSISFAPVSESDGSLREIGRQLSLLRSALLLMLSVRDKQIVAIDQLTQQIASLTTPQPTGDEAWQGVVAQGLVNGEDRDEALERMAAAVAAGPAELVIVTQPEAHGAMDAEVVRQWAVPALRPAPVPGMAHWERFAVRVERRAMDGPDHQVQVLVRPMPSSASWVQNRDLVDAVNQRMSADWPVSAEQVMRADAEVRRPFDSPSQVEARIAEYVRSFGRQGRLVGGAPLTQGGSDRGATPATLWNSPLTLVHLALPDLATGNSLDPETREIRFGAELRAELADIRTDDPEDDPDAEFEARIARGVIRWVRGAARSATSDSGMSWFQPGETRQRFNVEMELRLGRGSQASAADTEGLAAWLAALTSRELNVGISRWARDRQLRAVPHVNVTYSVVDSEHDPRSGLTLRYLASEPIPHPGRSVGEQRNDHRGSLVFLAPRDEVTGDLTEKGRAEVRQLAELLAAEALSRYGSDAPAAEVWMVARLDERRHDDGATARAVVDMFLDQLTSMVERRLVEDGRPVATADEVAEKVAIQLKAVGTEREEAGTESRPFEFRVLKYGGPPRRADAEGLRSHGWRASGVAQPMSNPVPLAVVDQIISALPDRAFRQVEFARDEPVETLDDRHAGLVRRTGVTVTHAAARVHIERPGAGVPTQSLRIFRTRMAFQPDDGLRPDTLDRYRNLVLTAIDEEVNRGFQLPDGDQLHVAIEFTDIGDADHVVTLTAGGQDGWADTGTWAEALLDQPNATYVVLHELMHATLGLGDEYFHQSRFGVRTIFRDVVPPHEARYPRVFDLEMGLMNRSVDSLFQERYLVQADFMQRNQVEVPVTTVQIVDGVPLVRETWPDRLRQFLGADPIAANVAFTAPRFADEAAAILRQQDWNVREGRTYAVLPEEHARRRFGGEAFPIWVRASAPVVPEGHRLLVFDTRFLETRAGDPHVALIPASWAEPTVETRGTFSFRAPRDRTPLDRERLFSSPAPRSPEGAMSPWLTRQALATELIERLGARGAQSSSEGRRRADALQWWQSAVGGNDELGSIMAGVRFIEHHSGAPGDATVLSVDAAVTILTGWHTAVTRRELTGAARDRVSRAVVELDRLDRDLGDVGLRLPGDLVETAREVLAGAARLRGRIEGLLAGAPTGPAVARDVARSRFGPLPIPAAVAPVRDDPWLQSLVARLGERPGRPLLTSCVTVLGRMVEFLHGGLAERRVRPHRAVDDTVIVGGVQQARARLLAGADWARVTSWPALLRDLGDLSPGSSALVVAGFPGDRPGHAVLLVRTSDGLRVVDPAQESMVLDAAEPVASLVDAIDVRAVLLDQAGRVLPPPDGSWASPEVRSELGALLETSFARTVEAMSGAGLPGGMPRADDWRAQGSARIRQASDPGDAALGGAPPAVPLELVAVRGGRWGALDAAVLSAPDRVAALLLGDDRDASSPAVSLQKMDARSGNGRAVEWLDGLPQRLQGLDRRAEVTGNGDFHDVVKRVAVRLAEVVRAPQRFGRADLSAPDSAIGDPLAEVRRQVADHAAEWGDQFADDPHWLVVLAQVLHMRLLVGSPDEPRGKSYDVPGVGAQAPVLRVWQESALQYRAWLEVRSEALSVGAGSSAADDPTPPPPVPLSPPQAESESESAAESEFESDAEAASESHAEALQAEAPAPQAESD